MITKIEGKIVSSRVRPAGEDLETESPAPEPAGKEPEPLKEMPKRWRPHNRPMEVDGTTYKISPATIDERMYVTINNITLEDGSKRPIEIFINTKNTSSFMWVTALTRVISALFRQPGDFLFIIQELKQVFDPQGGYFLPAGGGMCPSIVAHIGLVIEGHCKALGLIEDEEQSEVVKEVLAEKKEKAENSNVHKTLCPKCNQVEMVRMDGCDTCLNCGESKCG